jgi:WD40 repeat protein
LQNGNIASGAYEYYDKKQQGIIRLWNTTTGENIQTLCGHSLGVYSLTVLKNGNLVSACEDTKIKIWDLSLGKEIQTLFGHSALVGSLAVLFNGDLVSGSNDMTIKIWNAN